MMRTSLGGDFDAAHSAFANEFDRTSGGEMLNVQTSAGDLGKADVARDHDVLGRRGHAGNAESRRFEAFVHHAADGQLGHLAVLHDDAIEHRGVFQGATHERCRRDRRTVVCEADRAAGDKPAKLRQFFPARFLLTAPTG